MCLCTHPRDHMRSFGLMTKLAGNCGSKSFGLGVALRGPRPKKAIRIGIVGGNGMVCRRGGRVASTASALFTRGRLFPTVLP